MTILPATIPHPPRVENLPERKLIGMNRRLNHIDGGTPLLWKSFMPRRHEVPAIGPEVYSVQVFDSGYSFTDFDPAASFTRWAALAVADFDAIPAGMSALTIPAGLYAVFTHRGGPSRGEESFRYMLTEWLPENGYGLDQRPHFEILGAKYTGDSPDSEEEIRIPVKII